MAYLFPDNTVMVNFAAVDRLELLESYLRGRGRVLASVAVEIRKSAQMVPNLHQVDISGWFGEEIELSNEHDHRVQQIRVHSFGGTDKKPLEHLGESETIHLIQAVEEFSGSFFLTDDRNAYEFATGLGIFAHSTCEVLRAICADGDLVPQEAFRLCNQMWDLDRNPLNPPNSPMWFAS